MATLALVGCAVGVNTDGGDPAGGGGGGEEASVGDGGAGDAHHDSGSTHDSGSASSGDGGSQGDEGGSAAAEGGPGDSGGGSEGGVAEAAPPPSDGGCAGHGTTGVLVTYDMSSESGSETSAAPTSYVTGVSAGSLTRASALTAVSGSGSINASGWATAGSADSTKYFTFTVTPAAGCTVTLSSVALDLSASSTGPANGDVATSADTFGTHTASFAGTSTPSVALGSVSGTGAVEVRVYGYGASGTSGTLRIRNTMKVSGTIE
jgi:hypothetical protein